jgi:hypothetical protein
MAKYNGPTRPCYDCDKEDATEYLGRRIEPTKTGGPRGHLYLCKDCADARLSKGNYSPEAIAEAKKDIKRVEGYLNEPLPPPTPPTRSDSFAAGHQKEVFYQQEIPGLGE